MTWEERMAEKARERERLSNTRQVSKYEAELDAKYGPVSPEDVQHYEGTCDVCGEPLTMTWDRRRGIIDTAGTVEGRIYTWRRHGKDGPNQPDCDTYSSRVYRLPWDGPRDEQGNFINTVPVREDTRPQCPDCGARIDMVSGDDVEIVHMSEHVHSVKVPFRPMRIGGLSSTESDR